MNERLIAGPPQIHHQKKDKEKMKTRETKIKDHIEKEGS